MPHYINYKSDFDFILNIATCVKLEDGTCERRPLEWPDFDWIATFWTSNKANTYIASRKGNDLVNCFEDNGKIHIVVNNHHLGKGTLNVEFHALLPDAIYPDNIRDTYDPQPLDIELVTGPGDCPTSLHAQLLLPLLKGDKGDAFTYSDFTSEQLADLQKPAVEAAQRADTATLNAEKATEKANMATADAEKATQVVGKATDSANEAAANANTVANGLEETINGKQKQLVDSPDITVNDDKLSLTEMARYDSLVKQFIAAGGGFNDEAQLGALNGIEDLTYDDMAVILDAGRLTQSTGESFYARNSKLRTNLPPVYSWGTVCLSHTAWGCSSLEVFNANRCYLGYASFTGCKKLHTIIDVLYNEGGNINTCFSECESLKNFKLKLTNKATSFSLSFSPLIDLVSFQYIVTNAANGSALTITVHANVYAKLTGDDTSNAYADLTDEDKSQWTALVPAALAKNISFATV